MEKTTSALIILDGLGESEEIKGNAVKMANTPVLDSLKQKYPNVLISASGRAVGLPSDIMGNSEVGHINIGSGRVIYQDLTKIDIGIEDGSFFKNEALRWGIQTAINNNTTVHLVGLLSDGGVHSHYMHLFALLKLCKEMNAKKVCVHALLDGRDTPPKSARYYIELLQKEIDRLGIGEITTLCGRYYYMDRDNRWERVKLGYDMLMYGKGIQYANAINGIQTAYDEGLTDEFVTPRVKAGYNGLKENDTIIFFNFRRDRAREMTRAIVDKEFDHFDRNYIHINYVCMTDYDSTIQNVKIAYPTEEIVNTFGEYLQNNNMTQLRIAETEKYAHVTFFFNGGVEVKYNGEDRILIKSPSVPTYDMQPEMSAYEVTDNVVEAIKSRKYDVIILNYANCDMVGHTGSIEATKKAVEVVDECLGRVLDALHECGGRAVITADHGNAEKMLLADGTPCTSHTTNLVRFYVYDDKYVGATLRQGGALCDIVPTLLQIMGMKQPIEMTGKSLIEK